MISGQDLKWFFDQWFEYPGHPILEISHEYDSGMLNIVVSQTQDLSVSPLYRLPAMVDVWIKDSLYQFPVVVENEVDEFNLEVEVEPDLVVFDSENQVVGEVSHPKTYEELTYQFYHCQNMLPRYKTINLYSEQPGSEEQRVVLLDAFDDPFWAIRELAVSAFYEYEGDRQELVEKELIRIIETDKKSDVRAAAIESINSIDQNKYSDIYKNRINDSSVMVSSYAILSYLKTSPSDSMEIINRFKDSEYDMIAMSLANYFAEKRIFTMYDWFLARMQNMDDIELWTMLNFFNELNLYADAQRQRSSVDFLRTVATTNSKYYVRLAATQGLVLLDQLEGIEQILDEIKRGENDPELIEIYNRMF
jgi:aminopeptidase N